MLDDMARANVDGCFHAGKRAFILKASQPVAANLGYPDHFVIAKRREIPLRIIRICRGLGVAIAAAIVVDRAFIELVDAAYALDGSCTKVSYLDIEKQIATATLTGADGTCSGSGFLSESAGPATTVRTTSLISIDPDPVVIEALCDELKARAITCNAAGDGSRWRDFQFDQRRLGFAGRLPSRLNMAEKAEG